MKRLSLRRKRSRVRPPAPEEAVAFPDDLARFTQNQYGGQRFDAVGLFVQWLAEQLRRRTDRPFTIELKSWKDSGEVNLVISGGGYAKWPVPWLNELLERDGHGRLLRQEIARLVSEFER